MPQKINATLNPETNITAKLPPKSPQGKVTPTLKKRYPAILYLLWRAGVGNVYPTWWSLTAVYHCVLMSRIALLLTYSHYSASA